MELCDLTTERRNPATAEIDAVSTLDMLEMLNREDQRVAICVHEVLPQTAQAVEQIVRGMRAGGRLFYVGCGTSGRLAVCDAVECPPTFGTGLEQVQALIAGGREAMFAAIEGSEDDRAAAAQLILAHKLQAPDVIVGLTASGRTPFVLEAMDTARAQGAFTIGICNNRGAELGRHVQLCIEVEVGPEAITGSTRLKAGSAQKMILNMLSTACMVQLGKVYQNLMVDVQPTNQKLRQRCLHIISQATGIEGSEAQALFDASGENCKTAIVMQRLGIAREQARALLQQNQGSVRKTVEAVSQYDLKMKERV